MAPDKCQPRWSCYGESEVASVLRKLAVRGERLIWQGGPLELAQGTPACRRETPQATELGRLGFKTLLYHSLDCDFGQVTLLPLSFISAYMEGENKT